MEYSQEVIKRFTNPRNMGEIKDADAIGKVGNPRCGDVMWIYVKLKKDKNADVKTETSKDKSIGKELIRDIKFKTFGCTSAIASSDALCDLAKGKTVDEALKITKDDIIKVLGDLPAIKVHCSVLAHEGLADAIKKYRTK